MATKEEIYSRGMKLNHVVKALVASGRNPRDITKLTIDELEVITRGTIAPKSEPEAELHERDEDPEAAKAHAEALAGARAAVAKLARDDFGTFAEYVLRDEETGARIRLRPMHEEMCAGVAKHPFIVVEAHPESGKTNLLIVAYALWRLGRNPNLRIGLISAARDSAKKNLHSIKGYIEKSEALREVFPELKPGDMWSTEAIIVTRPNVMKDPSIQTLGVHGQIQGSRLDLALGDDLLDMENTRTKTLRIDTSKWFRSVVLARANECVFLTNTWHPEDLSVELVKERGFAHLQYPIYHRTTNECTWPERWPEAKIQDRKIKIGPLEFARLFLCLPRDEGAQAFTPESIERTLHRGRGRVLVPYLRDQDVPDDVIIVTGVDLAVTRRMKGAESAFYTVYVHPNTHRQVIGARSGRWGAREILTNLAEVGDAYGGVAVVEDNSAQKYLIEMANELDLDISIPVLSHTTGKNKIDAELGIDSMAAEFDAGRWILPSGRGGKSASTLEPEIRKLKSELEVYDQISHPGDRLMALWIARTYILKVLRRRRSRQGREGDVTVSVLG